MGLVQKKQPSLRQDQGGPLIRTACPLCGSSDESRILYRANFSNEQLTAETFSARRLPDRVHYQIVVCRNDGLVRSDPVLPEAEVRRLYKKSSFTYEDEVRNLGETYLAVLDRTLPHLPKSAAILEIGCGNGFLLAELMKRSYANVYGVEPSEAAVQKADPKIRGRIKNSVFIQGLFDESFFDLIFFFQTFDHIQDPSSFLKLCGQLLKPGGTVIAFNHDIESWPVRLFGSRSPVIDIAHPFLYSKDTMRRIFEKNRFTVVDIYSPANMISMRHLLELIPAPNALKTRLLRFPPARSLLSTAIRVKLGNLCLTARKAGP